MDRAKSYFTVRSTSAYHHHMALKGEHQNLLPVSSTSRQPRIQVRTLLGHCLYRRVLLWTLTLVILGSLVFVKTLHSGGKLTSVGDSWIGSKVHGDNVGNLSPAAGKKAEAGEHQDENSREDEKDDQQDMSEDESQEESPSTNFAETAGLHWLKFPQ